MLTFPGEGDFHSALDKSTQLYLQLKSMVPPVYQKPPKMLVSGLPALQFYIVILGLMLSRGPHRLGFQDLFFWVFTRKREKKIFSRKICLIYW